MISLKKNENLIKATKKGYITENPKEKRICIYKYSVANYDGIIDKSISETWFNYETGLFQEWTGYGNHYANYYDKYKDRNVVIEKANNMIN